MKRILVIDDELGFLELVKMNLEATGRYEVFTASSGWEGIEIAKHKPVDLILLDIIMPDMSGADVARKLEGEPLTKHIPIVFVTAVAKKEEVSARGGLIGGRPFLAKPVSVKEMLDLIGKILKE